MDRRKVLIGAATGLTAAASGVLVLTKSFSPPTVPPAAPKQISQTSEDQAAGGWVYQALDAAATGTIAYGMYENGGCMYASFGSILAQLAKQHGEPFASFPTHMMKYGSSGIGDYGSVCGSLNGAAAVVGLFVPNKSHRIAIIEEIFGWYEKTSLPVFQPEGKEKSVATVSNSVLCHVSTATWSKASGKRTDSKDRSERCSRLTADVTKKTIGLMNQYVEGGFKHEPAINIDAAGCIQCHGKPGKIGNIKGKMNCTACHEKTIAHKLFGDAHYHFMPEKSE